MLQCSTILKKHVSAQKWRQLQLLYHIAGLEQPDLERQNADQIGNHSNTSHNEKEVRELGPAAQKMQYTHA